MLLKRYAAAGSWEVLVGPDDVTATSYGSLGRQALRDVRHVPSCLQRSRVLAGKDERRVLLPGLEWVRGGGAMCSVYGQKRHDPAIAVTTPLLCRLRLEDEAVLSRACPTLTGVNALRSDPLVLGERC